MKHMNYRLFKVILIYGVILFAQISFSSTLCGTSIALSREWTSNLLSPAVVIQQEQFNLYFYELSQIENNRIPLLFQKMRTPFKGILSFFSKNRKKNRVSYLKDVYKKIFRKDILFGSTELNRFLMPLYFDYPNSLSKTIGEIKQKYLNLAYTGEGLYANNDDLWKKARRDLSKQGYTDIGSPNWQALHIDVFGAWIMLAQLTDKEYALLIKQLEKNLARSKKKLRFERANNKKFSIKEMLSFERKIGKFFIDADYHPPISKIAPFCDIPAKTWIKREDANSYAVKAEAIIKEYFEHYMIQVHRVSDPSILLNLMLKLGIKSKDLSKRNFAGFTQQLIFGNYMVVEIIDKTVLNATGDFYFLVPDDEMHEKCKVILNKAVDIGILTNDDKSKIISRLYAYRGFLVFLKQLHEKGIDTESRVISFANPLKYTSPIFYDYNQLLISL